MIHPNVAKFLVGYRSVPGIDYSSTTYSENDKFIQYRVYSSTGTSFVCTWYINYCCT